MESEDQIDHKVKMSEKIDMINYIDSNGESYSASTVDELSNIPNKHHNQGLHEIKHPQPIEDIKIEEGQKADEEKELEKSLDKRFIKYDKEVGRGSFKTVYKSLDSSTGSTVAWLELQPHKLTKEDRSRFKSEAEILKKLQHPNIVRFYDSWESSTGSKNMKTIVLITELMTSGTLKHYLKKFKVIRSKPLKSWSRQILLGLQYLHSRDPPILHRDLKCDNIFVTGQTGVVKIGDLGLATIKRHGGNAKSVIGTPEFMAPEMYEENYAEPADVYAFGMCLLEMVTNEYPYEECQNASQIFRKVSKAELPNAFRKVEDDKIKSIIKSCIEANPSERVTVQQLLENDFFEEKYLNVLVVGKNVNELKLRLVVNETGLNTQTHRRMPEDEAIDFTFRIGTDTALQVAQDMAKESTLNTADIPQVARSIQTAVDNYLKTSAQKLAPIHEATASQLANAEGTIKIIRTNQSLPASNSISDIKALVKESVEIQAQQPVLDTAEEIKIKEVCKEKTETKTEGSDMTVVPPAKDEVEVVKPVEPPVKSTKSTEEKKREKKKSNHKRISITVTQIKNKDDQRGWEVQVRITATDITIISFGVETLKTVDETVKQLSNEIIKNQLIPETLRDKAEKLLKDLIERMFDGNYLQPEKSYPTKVTWNGCRRLEDGNMEIEVAIDSVRHVPPHPVKFTMQKIDQQVRNIKEQGIILDTEVSSITKKFKEQLKASVQKMGNNKDKRQLGEFLAEEDEYLKQKKDPQIIELDLIQQTEDEMESREEEKTNSSTKTSPESSKENTITEGDNLNKKVKINLKAECHEVSDKEKEQEGTILHQKIGRFDIKQEVREGITEDVEKITSRFLIQKVVEKTELDSIVNLKNSEKPMTESAAQTEDEGNLTTNSLDKTTRDVIKNVSEKAAEQEVEQQQNLERRLNEKLRSVFPTSGSQVEPKPADPQHFVPRPAPKESSTSDGGINVNSMSESDIPDDIRSGRDLERNSSRILADFSVEMRKLRQQMEEQNKVLVETFATMNLQNQKFFDAWETMLEKLEKKNERRSNSRQKVRTKKKYSKSLKESNRIISESDESDPKIMHKGKLETMPKDVEEHKAPPYRPPNPSPGAEAGNPLYAYQQGLMGPGISSSLSNPRFPGTIDSSTTITQQLQHMQPSQMQIPNYSHSVVSEPAVQMERTQPTPQQQPPYMYPNLYTAHLPASLQRMQPAQVHLPSANALASLIPITQQQQLMTSGYGPEAINFALQLFNTMQQQPTVNQTLSQNLLNQQLIQNSQEQINQSANQPYYTPSVPASLHGGQNNETKQATNQQPQPSHSNMSINQPRQQSVEAPLIERDDSYARTSKWVENSQQQDPISQIADSMNGKDQLQSRQYDQAATLNQQGRFEPSAQKPPGTQAQQQVTRRESGYLLNSDQLLSNYMNQSLTQNMHQPQQPLQQFQQQAQQNAMISMQQNQQLQQQLQQKLMQQKQSVQQNAQLTSQLPPQMQTHQNMNTMQQYHPQSDTDPQKY